MLIDGAFISQREKKNVVYPNENPDHVTVVQGEDDRTALQGKVDLVCWFSQDCIRFLMRNRLARLTS